MNQTANLFKLQFKQTNDTHEPLSITTPIGKVILDIKLNTNKFFENLVTTEGIISDKCRIYVWDSKDIHLEILKIVFQPEIPIHMQVDDCVAFLVRFRCLKKVRPQFICSVVFKGLDLEGEPESGQGLIAQSFQDANFRLTIGTEDDEFLLYRAESQKGLPHRLFKDELINADLIEYLTDGIKVSLPAFEGGEEGQLQFVISWAKLKGTDPSSTWFAVDISPDKILQHIC